MEDHEILRGLIDLEADCASPRRTLDCAYTILMYCRVFEVDTEDRRERKKRGELPETADSPQQADEQLKRHEELALHIQTIRERITAVIREMKNVDYRKSSN